MQITNDRRNDKWLLFWLISAFMSHLFPITAQRLVFLSIDFEFIFENLSTFVHHEARLVLLSSLLSYWKKVPSLLCVYVSPA